MKKLASLLLAGAVIGLASCGNNENTSTKEQIDSMAAYRTDTMQTALKAKNDSLINAMAKMRADSAMQAEAMAKSGAKTTANSSKGNSHPVKTAKPVMVPHNTPTNVNDRPGGNGSSTDQNGKTINNNTPKNVNDRPGGN